MCAARQRRIAITYIAREYLSRHATIKNFSFFFFSSDDVRSSLDLLDSVIGEFDDGLLSAAESEYGGGGGGGGHGGGGRIEAEIRKRPPPKSKAMGSSNKNPLNQSEPPLKPAQTGPNGVSLTEKIDDIFSELTEEIYSADKQQKIMLRSESTNSDSAGRKLSPIRRVNDPLPTPPASSTRWVIFVSHNVVKAILKFLFLK